jgi:hypothetical protein
MLGRQHKYVFLIAAGEHRQHDTQNQEHATEISNAVSKLLNAAGTTQ